MKNFVTGGGGFIGSHLVDMLLDRGETVTVLDISRTIPPSLSKHKNEKNFKYIHGSILDKSLLMKVITKDYDRIFHLAAVVGVKNYCKDPLKTIDVNVFGTRNILDVALKHDIRLIFSSTSEIYGKNPDVPWSEDSDRVLGPTNIDRWSYSTSKSLCEHMLFAAHKTYGIPITILRYFNVYGPRQNPIFVIPAMIQQVLNNEAPLIFGDGTQTRCFTFVKDAVEATIKAAERQNTIGEAINIGSNHETRIVDLAELIIKKSGKNSLKPKMINPKKVYNSYEDLTRRIPDVKKAKLLFGWEAKTPLEAGIEITLEWYKKKLNLK